MSRDGFGEKIDTLLAEFRIILPALGAIFGFQLVVAFQPSFDALPPSARLASLAGTACTLLAIVFLLVPASFHRFTPELDQSADFLRFAQRNVGIAFVFLPLSLALSLYVLTVRVLHSRAAALALASAVLLILAYEWWLVPFRKAKRTERGERDG